VNLGTIAFAREGFSHYPGGGVLIDRNSGTAEAIGVGSPTGP